MQRKLLTIGIPTYNRVEVLDKSLRHLLPQVKPFAHDIEFIVSDNASSQNNQAIIDKYREQGYEISFKKQESNLGMDGNFSFLYEAAKSKYVWLLSDDDVVVENGFKRVYDFLKCNEVGALYLNNKWFGAEVDLSSFDANEENSIVIYQDNISYIKRVNYWVTFLSANIVNKDAIKNKVLVHEFQGTYLALLSWILPSIFQSLPNAVVENVILACRGTGQGGYKFVEVFATNFNKILDKFVDRGFPKEMKTIINFHLLKYYFPPFIIAKKTDALTSSSYKNENWFKSFFESYSTNINYYKYVMPAFLFPVRVYKKWYSIVG